MTQLLKVGICLGVVLGVAGVACMPASTQPPTQAGQPRKEIVASASEINNSLATLTKHTALATADYQIGPEDLLQITLFNVSDGEFKMTPRTLTVRVSHQGFVTLPLIGQLRVAGSTTVGLEGQLNKQYEKYFHSPEVGVLITEYRQRASVIGAVQKAGIFDLTGPKTVIDLLAMAGGVSEKAGTQVHIYRQGPNGRETHVIDLVALTNNATLINANNAGLITMPVQGGDLINVPPAGTFFVDGAVRSPGPYPLGRRYSLTQAVAAAGGVDRDFYSADVTIFRRRGGAGIEPIAIDFNAIREGSVTDPQIEADDVIVVPVSGIKYVYHKIFGQLLGWGTSIIGAAAISGT